MDRIRMARLEDIEAIMKLLGQVNDIHAKGRPDIFIAGKTKYSREETEQLIGNPENRIFVHADAEDHADGYCFCEIQDHSGHCNLLPFRTLYIDDLCVEEGHRGEGIGEKLFLHVKDWAKKMGFFNMTLNVWSCNPGAMDFYRKMGLIPQKTTLEIVVG